MLAEESCDGTEPQRYFMSGSSCALEAENLDESLIKH